MPHGVGEAVGEVSHNNKLLQVVLVSPQIPGNTGSIARTCAAAAVGLHLVEPIGFQVDDAKLKRAGLDYWPYPMKNLVCFLHLVIFCSSGVAPHTVTSSYLCLLFISSHEPYLSSTNLFFLLKLFFLCKNCSMLSCCLSMVGNLVLHLVY